MTQRTKDRKAREVAARKFYADKGIICTELFYRMAFHPTKRELSESLAYLHELHQAAAAARLERGSPLGVFSPRK